jgi:hypothetical protein
MPASPLAQLASIQAIAYMINHLLFSRAGITYIYVGGFVVAVVLN